MLNSFINLDFQDSYNATMSEHTVVNSLEIGGSEKYLVVIIFDQMQEFGPSVASEVLKNKKRLETCDLLCMVYDSDDPNSFSYVASLIV